MIIGPKVVYLYKTTFALFFFCCLSRYYISTGQMLVLKGFSLHSTAQIQAQEEFYSRSSRVSPSKNEHKHTTCSAPAHMVHVMKTVDPHGNTHGSSLKLNRSPHSNAPSVLRFILLSLPPPQHIYTCIHTHTTTQI